MSEEEWITLFAFHGKTIDGIRWVEADDYERVSERLRITLAQIAILKRALRSMSKHVSHLLDELEIENFGPETEYSVHIAAAAANYGVANTGDSAFDLDGMQPKHASFVNARIVGQEVHREAMRTHLSDIAMDAEALAANTTLPGG